MKVKLTVGDITLSKVDSLSILYTLDNKLPDTFDQNSKAFIERLIFVIDDDLEEDFKNSEE